MPAVALVERLALVALVATASVETLKQRLLEAPLQSVLVQEDVLQVNCLKIHVQSSVVKPQPPHVRLGVPPPQVVKVATAGRLTAVQAVRQLLAKGTPLVLTTLLMRRGLRLAHNPPLAPHKLVLVIRLCIPQRLG